MAGPSGPLYNPGGPILHNPFFSHVSERFQERTGSPWNADGHRDYTRTFLVISKVKEMSALAVAACPGIPQPGSIYITPNGVEYDLLAQVVSYNCRQQSQEDWQNWIVEVKYSTRTPPGGQSNNSQNNPESEPADIQWDSESLQQAPIHDLKGKPYLNSAQVPFSPPPTFDFPYPVLSISRNELTFDLNLADYYTNALNDRTFLGWPKGRAQCLRPVAHQKHRGKLRFWRVSYKIRFRRKYPTGSSEDPPFKMFDGVDDTWQPRILNSGLLERIFIGDDEERSTVSMWDKFNKRITTPQLLDELGQRQQNKDEHDQLIPTYKTFEQYPYANLAKLLTVGVGKIIPALNV